MAEMCDDERRFRQWIEAGYAGEMKYLKNRYEKHSSLMQNMPWAKSVIVVGINYYQKYDMPKRGGYVGRIARYAFGKDYHKVIGKKLKCMANVILQMTNDGQCPKVYVDTGPILERALAGRAGVGFIGKNTNLITREFGSWILLGEIFTDLSFEYEVPKEESWQTCGTCSRCLDVCPTGALKNAYELDARLCISYLTIENRSDIPVKLRTKIGNWLFGCDLCQDVCPFNRRAKMTGVKEFLTWKAGAFQHVIDILKIRTDKKFLKRFAGTPLMRAKRTGLLRNAAVVAGNFANQALIPVLLEVMLEEEDDMVKRHAGWAIRKILGIREIFELII